MVKSHAVFGYRPVEIKNAVVNNFNHIPLGIFSLKTKHVSNIKYSIMPKKDIGSSNTINIDEIVTQLRTLNYLVNVFVDNDRWVWI